MTHPNFDEEKILWDIGFDFVIGLDEVGRGSFAGPVVVGGVIFPRYCGLVDGVNDSKLLTPKKREELSWVIKKRAVHTEIAMSSVSIIDRYGVGKATYMAFRKVIKSIISKFPKERFFVLVDGFHVRYIRAIGLKSQKAIVKGDRKSISIAASSIVAKVERDKLMRALGDIYPNYGFERNKGYGTKEHQKAIRKFGLSKIHRLSFNLSYLTNYTTSAYDEEKSSLS